MSETFTNILTKIGQQKKAQAEASGIALNITTFKVGDGNGAYYEPTETQTALKNTKYTETFTAGTQSQIIINPSATNEVLYKCFIPADVGGFTIRELGLFDNDGDLILICKLPAQDKFALASGLYQPLTFTPKIIYTNPTTSAVLTPTSQTVPTVTEVINIISDKTTNFVKKDGLTPFLAEQEGVMATKLACLTTLQQVHELIDNIDFPNPLTKFCSNYGVTDINGNPSILTYSNSIITLNTTSVNPIITDHLGVSHTLTSDLTFSANGLTGMFYLFYKADGTIFKTTNSPVFANVRLSSPVSDTVYIYPNNETWVAEIYNGTIWTTLIGVAYLGYFVISSGIISSLVNNAYNQNKYNINAKSSGYRFPDYSNPITKTWNTTYTADADGWLWVLANNQATGVTVTINGNLIINFGTTSALVGDACFIPISKGDTYIVSGGYPGTQYTKFYPIKGVN